MHVECMALLFLTDVKPKIIQIRIKEKEPLPMRLAVRLKNSMRIMGLSGKERVYGYECISTRCRKIE